MFKGGFKFGHIYENNFMNSFVLTACIELFLGIFFTFYVVRRIQSERKFIALDLPNDILFDDISEKIKSSTWAIISKSEDLIEISTNMSLFSWGELMTIIKTDTNRILVNSRPTGSQPFTINRDKVNLKKLSELLH